MRNPLNILLKNPVTIKELRGRMRGPRAFVVLTGYLTLIGGFTVLLYLAMTRTAQTFTDQVDGGEIGRVLFAGVVGIELFLITFITPAFTAGAISSERERQTYDLLRTTLLPEHYLVMGKLFSALAYIFLLLLSAIPLQSLSFILGGTDVPDMAIAIVILMITAVLLGSIGIYFSATTRRTLSASIATYGIALTLVIGTALAGQVIIAITGEILSNNAVSATVEWIILILRGALICLNPIATLVVTRDYLVNQQSAWVFTYTFTSGNTTTLPSPWLVFSGVYLLISAMFFILTTRRIKKVDEF